MFFIVLYGGGPRLKTSMNYDIFQEWLKPFFITITTFIMGQWKPNKGCEYSPSLKKDQICVNPYHYERLRSQPIAPVLVPKLPPNQVPESLWNSMVNGFMPIHDEEKDWVVATNMTLGEQAFR